MPDRVGTRAGVFYSLAASLLAAGFFIPYKAAALASERGAVVCAMLVCAAGFNTVVTLVRRGNRGRPSRASGKAVLVFAGFTISGNVGVASALAVQKAAVTSVFLQTQVLIVTGLAWVFLRERVGVRFAIGASLAVGGFIVMNLPALGAGDAPVASASGVMWALTAATSFAIMQVYTRAVIAKIDAVLVNAARLWLAAVVFLAFPGNLSGLLALGGKTWLLCAGAAFLGPFLSRLCLMEAVRHIPAARVALIVMVNPVFAGALGFAAFGSIPTALEAGGAALILIGISAPLLTARTREEPR